MNTDRHGMPLPPGAIARLGTAGFRLWAVRDLAWSPDGSRLAGASYGEARVFDAVTGQTLHRAHMPGNVAAAARLLFVSDRELLVGTGRGTVVRYALSEHTPQLGEFGQRAEGPLAFAPDGSRVAVAGGGRVVLYKVSNGKRLRVLETPASALAFSAHSRWLAVGSLDGATVDVWDPRRGQATHRMQTGTVTDTLAWSPDHRWVAAGGHGLVVMDARKARKPIPMPVSGRVNRMAWSPDGTRLAAVGEVGDRGVVWLLDPGRRALIAQASEASPVRALAWSPDGRLATAGKGPPQLWSGELERQGHAGHQGAVRVVAFYRRDSRVLTGSADGTLRTWQVTGEPIALIDTGSAVQDAAVVEHDGAVAFYALGDSLSRWAEDGALERRYDVAGDAFCLVGDAAWVAGDDGVFRVDLVSGDIDQRRIQPHSGVAIHPDGRMVFVPVAGDAELIIGGERRLLRQLRGARWTPVGLLGWDNARTWLWPGRLRSLAQALGESPIIATYQGAPASLRHEVVATAHQYLRLFGLDGEARATRSLPRNWDRIAVALSDSAEQVVTGHVEGQSLVWDVPAVP